jgi:hypothetical protein
MRHFRQRARSSTVAPLVNSERGDYMCRRLGLCTNPSNAHGATERLDGPCCFPRIGSCASFRQDTTLSDGAFYEKLGISSAVVGWENGDSIRQWIPKHGWGRRGPTITKRVIRIPGPAPVKSPFNAQIVSLRRKTGWSDRGTLCACAAFYDW